MLKYIFALVVLMHGLIHFMGFAKAFGYGNITQLTKDISKPAGFFWFLTAILFIITTILFLLKKGSWPVFAIIAAVLSQVLIFNSWKDARFGTIVNIIILLVAVPALANIQFNKLIDKQAAVLLSQPAPPKIIITTEMMDNLPPIVRKWLLTSGVPGKEKIQFVRLKQKGIMRTKPGGKWIPFEAKQYYTVNEPQFIWQANVQMMPLINLTGRDKFIDGIGEMQIKLLSLVNVVNAGGTDKINSAAMIRYLAEIIWFPTAALNNYIQWESIGPNSAKATMIYKGISVSGIMTFTENGDLLSFEANRYMDNGKKSSLEKWLVEITAYKVFDGIRVPYKSKITWKLKSGDFDWLMLELTGLEYNHPAVYH